ncbi:MAG: hypothetical protein AB1638_02150, partial [Nitrospirota bacterium]
KNNFRVDFVKIDFTKSPTIDFLSPTHIYLLPIFYLDTFIGCLKHSGRFLSVSASGSTPPQYLFKKSSLLILCPEQKPETSILSHLNV